jgi:hypothetical protein
MFVLEDTFVFRFTSFFYPHNQIVASTIERSKRIVLASLEKLSG